MLHPSRFGENLLVLFLVQPRNFTCTVKNNETRAGGPLVNRPYISGHVVTCLLGEFEGIDSGIISVSGIDSDGSLVDFDYREVRVGQAIIENSRKVFLVADHTKFGREAMVRLCNIREVDSLFTDRRPEPHMCEMLASADVALHVVDEASREP